MILEWINDFLQNVLIVEFFQSIEKDIVEFLSWITASIVAFIALLTILINYYSERTIFQMHDITRKMQEDINDQNDINYSLIHNDLNYMYKLLATKSTYQASFLFFKVICRLLILLWILGAVGLMYQTSSVGSEILIISSIFVFFITFYFIPNFFEKIITDEPLKVDPKKGLSLYSLNSYIRTYLKVNTRIDKILSPKLFIKLQNNKDIIFELTQTIPVSKYSLTYIFYENELPLYYLHLTLSDNCCGSSFILSLESKVFKGLFKNLSACSRFTLYLVSIDRQIVNCYNCVSDVKDSVLTIQPTDEFHSKIVKAVEELIVSKQSILKLINDNREYKLSKKKKDE